MLTQEQLKEILHYCPETGIFTRKIKTSHKKVGQVFGCKGRAGYLSSSIDGKVYKSHRLAFLYMTGSFPLEQVDHINQVKHDNRWENLRDVTAGENLKNQSMQRRNTSGCTGVRWDEARQKWNAQISADGKMKWLGRFDCIDDAIKVRRAAEIKYGYHENHGLTV